MILLTLFSSLRHLPITTPPIPKAAGSLLFKSPVKIIGKYVLFTGIKVQDKQVSGVNS